VPPKSEANFKCLAAMSTEDRNELLLLFSQGELTARQLQRNVSKKKKQQKIITE